MIMIEELETIVAPLDKEAAIDAAIGGVGILLITIGILC